MLDLGKYLCIAGKWGRWKYEKQLYKWWTLVPIWLAGGVCGRLQKPSKGNKTKITSMHQPNCTTPHFMKSFSYA